MISSPDDFGELTAVGNLAGCLPVDMHLSRLIAFGIMLGIGAETIALAAAFSLPKSPFRIAHPLVHKGMS
jgi:HrpA-like RNA helicase